MERGLLDFGYSNLEMGYNGRKMMDSDSGVAESAVSTLKQVTDMTLIKPVVDMLSGRRE